MFLKELQNLDVVEYPLLGFVFRTDGSIYFYDTVSAEIIGISPFMKKLIEALLKKTKALRLKKLSETANLYSEEKVLKGLKIINLKRKNENILEQFSGDFEIGLKDQFHPRKASFNHLVIEVTQNCNLRCKYCIYGENYTHERKYSSAVIDKNAAFKAIKLFLDSPGHPEPKITFFGGEPLLTKELIEDCVKYAKEINPKTVFVIVTNGYLLKPTYFDFIRNHQIRIAVSFDGPKKFHDSYRVLPGGEGTFDEIKSNIEKLYEIDGEYVKKNFSFYITLTDIKNLKEISKFLKQNHLFNNLPVAISKITDAGLKENINEYKNQVPKSKNLKSLLNGYVNNYNEEGFKRVTAEHAYFFPLARLITNRKPLK